MVRSMRLLAACAALVAVPAFGQNLVLNGSFELPALGAGSWSVVPVPDWAPVSGSGVEVQNNVAGVPYAGSQHIELDGYDNSGIEQSVPVVPGGTYRLAWAYSPRPGVAQASNPVDVLVDGAILLTNAADGTANANTAWTVHQAQLVAAGPAITLGFRAGGTSDGVGGYIDDVSLTLVALPRAAAPVDASSNATLALMALALAAAGVLALSRRG